MAATDKVSRFTFTIQDFRPDALTEAKFESGELDWDEWVDEQEKRQIAQGWTPACEREMALDCTVSEFEEHLANIQDELSEVESRFEMTEPFTYGGEQLEDGTWDFGFSSAYEIRPEDADKAWSVVAALMRPLEG